MSAKKQRVEIPPDIAAEILFLSDRTCCICRKREKPVTLHHVDENPSNSTRENLAVVCFDCHRETQIRGGFDRKLNAEQVRLYREDWTKRVEARRTEEYGPAQRASINGTYLLRYLQTREKSDEHFYDFEADYALVGSPDSVADAETNACINAFVTRHLQRFRVNAIARSAEKLEMQHSWGATAWDSLVISHSVSLFNLKILSLEFQLYGYSAGAAHPNTYTETLNFQLHPSMQLELNDIFEASWLQVLSEYCVNDLHTQQPKRWQDPEERSEFLKNHQDEWILQGAGPEVRNFEHISFRRHGIVVHFDPYQVGSYAEGKYEVFIPAYKLESVLRKEILALMG